ncbi:hypothetical protein COCVIDRAFT_88130, partial [Bipolaris victoriae FI3]
LHLPGTHLAFPSEQSIKAAEILNFLMRVVAPIWIRHKPRPCIVVRLTTSRRRIVYELY